MFKYSLSNKRRIDCPFCGKKGKYSAFINNNTQELAPVEYGMCSSCRKSKRPPDNYIQGESSYIDSNDTGYYEADTVHINLINQYHQKESHVQNNFIDGLKYYFEKDMVKHAVDHYKLGRFADSGIIFPYLYTNNHACTGKIMFYDNRLHRIREGKKKYPKFLHNLIYTADNGQQYDYINDDINPFSLKMCLFGHNQIINNREKVICLVESEKTAVIMSIVLPNYIWVASGGKTLIQDYKFLFFKGRKCLAFPDLSEDDNVYQYWFDKLTYYNRKFGYDIEVIDYYSEFLKYDDELIRYSKYEGKFDIADFMMHFNQDNMYMDFIKDKLEGKLKTHV